MEILILDNYDSFTYNLVHLLRVFDDVNLEIVRNDKISMPEIEKYDKILLSPGPGIPSEAGIMMDLIKAYAPVKSILGVCLGMQGIAEAFDGKLCNLSHVMHGVSSTTLVKDDTEKLFRGLPAHFQSGRYHSWIVDQASLPSCFRVTAVDEENHLMAISHKEYDLRDVQFHPESIMTEYGKEMIANWLYAE
jgi:anthranilate synthase component 2